jgi:hypothetical protein
MSTGLAGWYRAALIGLSVLLLAVWLGPVWLQCRAIDEAIVQLRRNGSVPTEVTVPIPYNHGLALLKVTQSGLLVRADPSGSVSIHWIDSDKTTLRPSLILYALIPAAVSLGLVVLGASTWAKSGGSRLWRVYHVVLWGFAFTTALWFVAT